MNTPTSIKNWTPSSFRGFPISQQPSYSSKEDLDNVLNHLKNSQSITQPFEIEELKSELADCAKGEKIFLQGGDCAERFADCESSIIKMKARTMFLMAHIISEITGKEVIKVGRIAGQYSKPRSSPFEMVNGERVLSFKGDNVNSIDTDKREHCPKRLVEGYNKSLITVETIKNFIQKDALKLNQHLRKMKSTRLFVDKKNSVYTKTRNILKTFEIKLSESEKLKKNNKDFYVSHEGLILDYEESLTRTDVLDMDSDDVFTEKKHYNLSTHFLWIGERTRAINEAHVEYFRGIQNPIGIKVGPNVDHKSFIEVIKILNPFNIPGRIVVISRMGANKVRTALPLLVHQMKAEGLNVVWICDPMHGNGYTNKNNVKTRNCDDIFAELLETMDILKRNDQIIGGVHLEMTGEHVTECVGGECDITDEDLTTNYTSLCDPRLNLEQSLECALLFAQKYKELYVRY